MIFKTILKLFRAPKKPRRIILRTHGKHFNLKEIYDRLNEQYFEGKVDLHITWFGPKKSRYQRRIVLGCYHHHTKLVKINQILDQADIPDYFIAFIVYHEMLHHVLPPLVYQRRRQIHHREFKHREKQFHDFEQVKEFRQKSKMRWFVD